ncbi:MAG: DUF1330 domain-containing protein [Planctomycetota bacterium]|jgi:uncharacterized protein (DUF1330 family)
MPAYLIANVDIKDAAKFTDYMKATPSIIKQFGGKFLVRGGDFEICEGSWNPKRLVLVEFESMQKAKQFYNSPEYKAIKQGPLAQVAHPTRLTGQLFILLFFF